MPDPDFAKLEAEEKGAFAKLKAEAEGKKTFRNLEEEAMRRASGNVEGAKKKLENFGKKTEKLSDFTEKAEQEDSPTKYPALPDNFNIDTTAKRLPDSIVGQSEEIPDTNIAREDADLMATTNLLHEIYNAVYGKIPTYIETAISTYYINKRYEDGINGSKVTYPLTQAIKRRLIQDFVQKVLTQKN